MDSKILNKIAHQIFATENPSINLSAKRIISPFITNKNKPKVMIVTGRVKMTKSGFTKRFKTDNTNATIIADT